MLFRIVLIGGAKASASIATFSFICRTIRCYHKSYSLPSFEYMLTVSVYNTNSSYSNKYKSERWVDRFAYFSKALIKRVWCVWMVRIGWSHRRYDRNMFTPDSVWVWWCCFVALLKEGITKQRSSPFRVMYTMGTRGEHLLQRDLHRKNMFSI